MKPLACLFLILAVLDLWIAAYVLREPQFELNPIPAMIWSNYGFAVLALFKLLMTAFVVALAHSLPAEAGLLTLRLASAVIAGGMVAGCLI